MPSLPILTISRNLTRGAVASLYTVPTDIDGAAMKEVLAVDITAVNRFAGADLLIDVWREDGAANRFYLEARKFLEGDNTDKTTRGAYRLPFKVLSLAVGDAIKALTYAIRDNLSSWDAGSVDDWTSEDIDWFGADPATTNEPLADIHLTVTREVE